DLLDGLFVRTDTGPVLTLSGHIAAGAALSLEAASAGVEGGVFATINASLVDPNGDGKLRPREFVDQLIEDPLGLFDISGGLDFRLFAFVDVDFLAIHWSKDIVPPISLLSFRFVQPPPPVLGTEDANGVLTVSTGSRANLRHT